MARGLGEADGGDFGSPYDMIDSWEGKTREGHMAFERSPCVAEHVTLYLVELRVPGGHAC